jgi:5-methylcytosine-specific restriction endonuclease McrA
VFCSETCATRQYRRLDRAREHARRRAIRSVTIETVDPLLVFERDGWVCQICRIITPRGMRGTHDPRAPELDHIVPLAAGGEHSYRNTQCACRDCNGKKGDGGHGKRRLSARSRKATKDIESATETGTARVSIGDPTGRGPDARDRAEATA